MTQRIAIVFRTTLLLAIGATIGCRTDPSIELLESELRWYEDQLYLLNRQLDQTCVQLESCRRYNSVLQRESAEGSRAPSTQPCTPAAGERPERPATDRTAPRTGRGADDDEITDEDLVAPEVDYGTEVPSLDDTENIPGPDGEPPADVQPPKIQRDLDPTGPTDLEDMTSADSRMTSADSRSSVVAAIVLNQRLTGGCDFDGQPGDDGITVVIEPRDASGRYVAMPGEVSVVVSDPQKPAAHARWARWDFDAADAAGKMRQSLLGKGIHLELPWPAERPTSRTMRVDVSYIGPDGRRLRAAREVFLESPSDKAERVIGAPVASVTRALYDDGDMEHLPDAGGASTQALPDELPQEAPAWGPHR